MLCDIMLIPNSKSKIENKNRNENRNEKENEIK